MTFKVFRTPAIKPRWSLETTKVALFPGAYTDSRAREMHSCAFSMVFPMASAGGGTTLVSLVVERDRFANIMEMMMIVDPQATADAFKHIRRDGPSRLVGVQPSSIQSHRSGSKGYSAQPSGDVAALHSTGSSWREVRLRRKAFNACIAASD